MAGPDGSTESSILLKPKVNPKKGSVCVSFGRAVASNT